jgi:protein-tyrosine phosphatase
MAKEPKRPLSESYWVEPGRLLAGEYAGSHDPERTRRRLDAFLEAGVNTFIDLTQPHEHVPYELILKEQARIYEVNASYHRFGIPDHRVPARETMSAVLDAIDRALNDGGRVYLHCWGGVGRTGMAVGCHLVRRGLEPREALARVNELFRTRPPNSYFRASPETLEQMEFILNWRENPPEAGAG